MTPSGFWKSIRFWKNKSEDQSSQRRRPRHRALLQFDTDAAHQQPDEDGTNNVRAMPIALTAPARPDLIVTAASAPNTAALGQAINVSYTVANQGQGATSRAWRDGVYFSRDAALDA